MTAKRRLPEALRVVLGSEIKLEILCLLSELGPTEGKELAAALQEPIHHNSINLHLRALEKFGWIRIGQLRQRRGSFARVWELTDPAFSWSQLIDQLEITAQPQPQPQPAPS